MRENQIHTYQVSGMTCSHCVTAVTQEVSALPDVQAVSVELQTGKLQVTSPVAPDRALLAEAVAEAGYKLEES